MLLGHFRDTPAESIARIVGHDETTLYERQSQVSPHALALQEDFRASGAQTLTAHFCTRVPHQCYWLWLILNFPAKVKWLRLDILPIHTVLHNLPSPSQQELGRHSVTTGHHSKNHAHPSPEKPSSLRANLRTLVVSPSRHRMCSREIGLTSTFATPWPCPSASTCHPAPWHSSTVLGHSPVSLPWPSWWVFSFEMLSKCWETFFEPQADQFPVQSSLARAWSLPSRNRSQRLHRKSPSLRRSTVPLLCRPIPEFLSSSNKRRNPSRRVFWARINFLPFASVFVRFPHLSLQNLDFHIHATGLCVQRVHLRVWTTEKARQVVHCHHQPTIFNVWNPFFVFPRSFKTDPCSRTDQSSHRDLEAHWQHALAIRRSLQSRPSRCAFRQLFVHVTCPIPLATKRDTRNRVVGHLQIR